MELVNYKFNLSLAENDLEIEPDNRKKKNLIGYIINDYSYGFLSDYLVKNLSELNFQTLKGLTPLMLSIIKNNDKFTDLLLQHNVDVNAKTIHGITALMIAVKKCNFKIIKKLLNKKADLNFQNNNGFNAIIIAARNSRSLPYMVNFLLERGANKDLLDINGLNAFMHAVKNSNSESDLDAVVKLLDKNTINLKNYDGNSALFLAIKNFHNGKSNYQTIKYLLENGADVNTVDNRNNTPILNIFEFEKDEDLAELLLEYNPDIDIVSDNMNTSLHYAIINYPNNTSKKIIFKMIDLIKNINIQNDKGQTVLMLACLKNDEDIIIKILEKKPNLNIICQNGNNCLFYAMLSENDIIPKIIISHAITQKNVSMDGIKIIPKEELLDFNHMNNFKKNVLHFAMDKINTSTKIDVIKCLLENRTNCHLRNFSDWTPLMLCIKNCENNYYLHVINLLLTYGANFDQDCNSTLNPLVITFLYNKSKFKHEILSLLLNYIESSKLKNSNILFEIISKKKIYTPDDYKTIKLLIEKGVDLEMIKEGHSILSFAVYQKKNVDLIKFLIDLGSNINIKIENTTLLHHLLGYLSPYNYNLLNIFFSYNLDINIQDVSGWTPLLLCTNLHLKDDYSEFIKRLLKRGADVNLSNNQNANPLHFIKNINVELTEELTSTNVDLAINQKNKMGDTPLLNLIKKSHNYKNIDTKIKILLEKGADPNISDFKNMTVLHLVIKRFLGFNSFIFFDIINSLIEYGADINALDEVGHSPLSYSIINFNGRYSYDIIKFLIKNGADVNIFINEKSLLYLALENIPLDFKYNVIKMFLEKDITLNSKSNFLYNPIEYMIKNSKKEDVCDIIYLLLEKNYQIELEYDGNTKNFMDICLLDSDWFNETICNALLDKNYKLENLDRNGFNYLFYLINITNDKNLKEKIRFIASKININQVFINNFTALSYCISNFSLTDKDYLNKLEIIKILLENGASINLEENNEKNAILMALSKEPSVTNQLLYILINEKNINQILLNETIFNLLKNKVGDEIIENIIEEIIKRKYKK